MSSTLSSKAAHLSFSYFKYTFLLECDLSAGLSLVVVY